MERKDFLKTMPLPPFGVAMKLNALHTISQNLEATERIPILFLGHGNPMNAIENNIFTQGFESIPKTSMML